MVISLENVRMSLTNRGLPAEDCDVRVLINAILWNKNCRHCDRKMCGNTCKFTVITELVTYRGSLYARYGDCRKVRRRPIVEELIENVIDESNDLI